MNDKVNNKKEQTVSGEGIKVRIFDLDKGLTEYEHVKYVNGC